VGYRCDMASGKYLSLEEARKKKGGLACFAKKHPSKGDERRLDRLARYGLRNARSKDRTSSAADGKP
jgi:hypothetical protein